MRSAYYIIVLFMIFLSGCSVESLPISVEPAEQQIAVSSLVGPEETFFVTLSYSFSALSAEDADQLSEDFLERILIDRAFATLQYGNTIDTLESLGDIPGLYGTELQFFEDFQLMELSVYDSSTTETVTASSELLPQVDFQEISITHQQSDIEGLVQLNYSIPDRPEENFYLVQAYQLARDGNSDTTAAQNIFFSEGNLLVFEQLLTDRGADEDGLITKEESFEFTSSTDSALVVLTNISEGYYNFLEARRRSGGLVSSLANEPVNHPTNVNNGVGYFSAHQPRLRVVPVDE